MRSGLIQDLQSYTTKSLVRDLVSGLMVAVVLIPQALAYAVLAGMPPVYGLYASLVPLTIYAFFGSSRHLSVGPVALMSIIVFSGLSVFAEPGSQAYINLVLMVALMSGIFQLLFAILKLGSLSNFLSNPVMNGFISAAGIIIIVSQIKDLLKLPFKGSGSFMQMLMDNMTHMGSFHVASTILGLVSILLLLILKYLIPRLPNYLIIAVLGTLTLYFFQNYFDEVAIVGNIPSHFPPFNDDFFDASRIIELIPLSLAVSIVCFIGSYSIAKTLAGPNQASNKISANQELMALGLAKVFGSFFLAMPSTGSFSRSSINYTSGAKTAMSGIVTVLIIALVLSNFGFIFYYLPRPVLAAIVIVSVLGLVNVSETKRLYQEDRIDFWIFIATFLLTLVLGIVNGIITGILLSLLSVVLRASKPHFAELGRLPGTHSYRNINRYSDAIVEEHILILRYDHDLFFANAEHFYRSIIGRIDARKPLEKLILHVGGINSIDSTAMNKLIDLNEYCKKNGIVFELTNVSGPVRDRIFKSEFYEYLGRDRLHLSIAHAILGENHEDVQKKNLSLKYSKQNDLKKKE